MEYLRKESTGRLVGCTCTPEQEALCNSFLSTYTVEYHALTEGLYGSAHEPVTLDEYTHLYNADRLTCILETVDGADTVVGCMCEERMYLLNGTREYQQNSGPGPQGALIWDSKTWRLVKRSG